ncbi:retrovirus-related pol polyprotein from transposon TNT 1-94 [Tanacetum coccineum]
MQGAVVFRVLELYKPLEVLLVDCTTSLEHKLRTRYFVRFGVVRFISQGYQNKQRSENNSKTCRGCKVRMKSLLEQEGLAAALEELPTATIVAYDNVIQKMAYSALILCLGDRVLREITKETTAAGIWKKLETLYLTKSLAKCNLVAIDTAISIEDHALLLLTSLPLSYDNFIETLLYGWDTLKLEDVLATLTSRELQKMTKAKGDGGEGLYVRGRFGQIDIEQGKDSAWLKSHGRSNKLRCYICQSEEHLKRDCPRYNHKKYQGFVRNEDQVSGYRADGYDNADVMMAMSVKELLDWIMDSRGSYYITYKRDYLVDFKEYDGGNILLGDGSKCRVRGTCTLEKEGFTVKMQSGKIKEAVRRIADWVEDQDGIQQHNGLVEETNMTLLAKVRCFLIQSGLSKVFWAEDTTISTYLGKMSPSSAIGFKKPIDVLGFLVGLLVLSKGCLNRNMGFNESGEYKKTFISSGVGTSSVQVLQRGEFEVELQEDHTFKVEPHGNVDHVADKTVMRLLLQLWDFQVKAGLQDDMRCSFSNVYCSAQTVCKGIAKIWATKGLLDKAKGNVLGIEIFRDQRGNTLRVSWSRFYNVVMNYAVIGLKQRVIIGATRDLDKHLRMHWDKLEIIFDRGLQTRPQAIRGLRFQHRLNLQSIDVHNELVQIFRTARDKCREIDVPEFKIRLYNAEGARGYELPTSNTLGVMVFESGIISNTDFDVIIQHKDGPTQRINKLHPSYMSLQFPFIFIYGQSGYHTNLKLKSVDGSGKATRVTLLAEEDCSRNTSLVFFALLNKTGWTLRKKQNDIRSDYLSGLYDAISRDSASRIQTAKDVDRFISAELPDPGIDPNGYKVVSEMMMHGPCRAANLKAPCMQGTDIIFSRVCKTIGESSTKAGPSRQVVDEIQNYVEVHLEDMQRVTFRDKDRLQSVVDLPGKKNTTLTEWFAYNVANEMDRHLTYLEFLSEFVCHGGTRKTFLWKTIIDTLLSESKIVLALASLGIDSLLLPSGRTAHSKFKLPLELTEESLCIITKNTHLGKLLVDIDLIIWDEAPMNDRRCFEALDKSL